MVTRRLADGVKIMEEMRSHVEARQVTHLVMDWFILGPRTGRKVHQVGSGHFLLVWFIGL